MSVTLKPRLQNLWPWVEMVMTLGGKGQPTTDQLQGKNMPSGVVKNQSGLEVNKKSKSES